MNIYSMVKNALWVMPVSALLLACAMESPVERTEPGEAAGEAEEEEETGSTSEAATCSNTHNTHCTLAKAHANALCTTCSGGRGRCTLENNCCPKARACAESPAGYTFYICCPSGYVCSGIPNNPCRKL